MKRIAGPVLALDRFASAAFLVPGSQEAASSGPIWRRRSLVRGRSGRVAFGAAAAAAVTSRWPAAPRRPARRPTLGSTASARAPR